MKFILIFVIALVVLSVSEAKKKRPVKSKDFCDGQERSKGPQLPGGSCSTGIQGRIPSSDNMPSTLIITPINGEILKPNEAFSVVFIMDNIETGHFSDPETDYNIEPQDLNSDGLILGHTHVTIQELKGNKPPNAKEFAFFKGVNDKADSGGRLTVDVVGEDGRPGLPAGRYRICTMAGSFSHQALVMPVAKRGSQDDCIRIKVEEQDKHGEQHGKQGKQHEEQGKGGEQHGKHGKQHEEQGKGGKQHGKHGKQPSEPKH